jgi:spermidine/putrescine transport system ATP-binding protein
MTTRSIVRLDHVVKRFGSFTAVQGMSLDIREGEFITLLGASGCGKSTTLRMLGGFETPNEGSIHVADRDVTHLPPDKRDVNMVFQDYALFPHLNVFRNIAFSLELRRMPRDAIRKRVTELLELVHLGSFAQRYPHELSGGQRQRVALVRALAPDPSILLLDEPLGALDAQLRQQMQTELKALQETTGKTFLLVTHDQDEALFLSDRIVLMAQGRIEQQGNPEDLYNRPATAYAASFIGEASLLPCTLLQSTAQGATVRLGDSTIDVTQPGLSAAAGENLSFVVRPEWWRVQDGPGSLVGRVFERKYRGSRLDIGVELAGGHKATLIWPQENEPPTTGDEVSLSVRRGKGVLVDAANPHRSLQGGA